MRGTITEMPYFPNKDRVFNRAVRTDAVDTFQENLSKGIAIELRIP